MNKQSVALALKGYSRRELPGWGWVLRRAGVFDDSVWREAPTAVAEGKLHGFRMELDLRNWSERQTYFLGRFYDLPTQLLVMRLLRRGDLFVDVGANIGMISALAARWPRAASGRRAACWPSSPIPTRCAACGA